MVSSSHSSCPMIFHCLRVSYPTCSLVSSYKPDYAEFTAAADDVCSTKNLQPTEFFVQKLIQTYEMMIVRHGFMLVSAPLL